jgi:hypothetical protein
MSGTATASHQKIRPTSPPAQNQRSHGYLYDWMFSNPSDIPAVWRPARSQKNLSFSSSFKNTSLHSIGNDQSTTRYPKAAHIRNLFSTVSQSSNFAVAVRDARNCQFHRIVQTVAHSASRMAWTGRAARSMRHAAVWGRQLCFRPRRASIRNAS